MLVFLTILVAGIPEYEDFLAAKIYKPKYVPVANTGGPGTFGGHWRESTFDTELMTGFVDIGLMPLSKLTIACLDDMGYEVDYDAAEPYQIPAAVPLRAIRECRHLARPIRVKI